MRKHIEAHKVRDAIDGDFWMWAVYEGTNLRYDSAPASYATKADALYEGRKHLASGEPATAVKGRDWS